MTETGSGVVYDGAPLDGVEVRVVDGELQLRCPMLMRCYRDGTRPTDARRVVPHRRSRRAVDDRRLVSVHGRKGDLIITGGENVWPEPVEAVLREHPAVADVAVGATAAGRGAGQAGARRAGCLSVLEPRRLHL